MQIEMDHVVLEVRDVPAAVEFYRSLLGFEPVRLKEFEAGEAPFASARVNPVTLIDFFPVAMWRDPTKPENPNHICFTLSAEQVAALRKRMEAAQVPITKTLEVSYGAQGNARSIYFDDPEGVGLEARVYPSGE